jgi:hypothetical protein
MNSVPRGLAAVPLFLVGRLAVSVALLLAFCPTATASEFDWALMSNAQTDTPIEQQTPWIDDGCSADGVCGTWWPNDTSLWVTNPTGCIWDADDRRQLFAGGSLRAGVPAVERFCVVAEPYSVSTTRWGVEGLYGLPRRLAAVSVTSRSPDLKVAACFAPGGCTSFPAVRDGRDYKYAGCVRVAYDDNDPAVVEIPGSNRGIGVLTQGSLTVTAPKRAAASGTALLAGGHGDVSSYCPVGAAVETAYPLTRYR